MCTGAPDFQKLQAIGHFNKFSSPKWSLESLTTMPRGHHRRYTLDLPPKTRRYYGGSLQFFYIIKG